MPTADASITNPIQSISSTGVRYAGLVFADNFNVSDGSLPTGWSVTGPNASASISSGKAVLSTSAFDASFLSLLRAEILADVVVEADCTAIDNTAYGGMSAILRRQPSGEMYVGYIPQIPGYARIIYFSPTGAITDLTAYTGDVIQPGDRIRFIAKGSYLRCSYIRNGVEYVMGSVNDTRIPGAGLSGISTDTRSISIDNFTLYTATNTAAASLSNPVQTISSAGVRAVPIYTGNAALTSPIVVSIPGINIANAANGATATASSSYSSEYPPSDAMDGNVATSWYSTDEDYAAISPDPWIDIRFPTLKSINKVILKHTIYEINTDYKLYYYTTVGGSLTLITNRTGNNSAIVTENFSTVQARGIRLEIQNNSGGDYATVTDLEVYTEPSTSSQINGVATNPFKSSVALVNPVQTTTGTATYKSKSFGTVALTNPIQSVSSAGKASWHLFVSITNPIQSITSTGSMPWYLYAVITNPMPVISGQAILEVGNDAIAASIGQLDLMTINSGVISIVSSNIGEVSVSPTISADVDIITL